MYRVEFNRYVKYAPNARHRLDDGGVVTDWMMGESLVQSELTKGLVLYEG